MPICLRNCISSNFLVEEDIAHTHDYDQSNSIWKGQYATESVEDRLDRRVTVHVDAASWPVLSMELRLSTCPSSFMERD